MQLSLPTFTGHPVQDQPALLNLYRSLNDQYFEGDLPLCKITWSSRLTHTGGHISPDRRLITLSRPLLLEKFKQVTLFPPEFEVCGVLCTSSDEAIREVMKHEMIHFWLHLQRLPYGHNSLFRAKARSLGQSSIRHLITPTSRAGDLIYRCPGCGGEITRRRAPRRPIACLSCCRRHNRGKFDQRFQLSRVGRTPRAV